MEKKIRLLRIFTCVTVIVMFICIIILSFQLIKINHLKNQEKELLARKEQLIEEIYNYNTTNSYYENNRAEYLENYAKEVLNWSEEDDVWYTKE